MAVRDHVAWRDGGQWPRAVYRTPLDNKEVSFTAVAGLLTPSSISPRALSG